MWIKKAIRWKYVISIFIKDTNPQKYPQTSTVIHKLLVIKEEVINK